MLGDGATSSVMMGAINGSENLRNDLSAYMMAKKNGDDALFDKYADEAYDSSADYWKLKTVLDADGNVVSYSVDWDGSLDLTIENADGTTTKIAAGQIQTETGLGSISQWFAENGLAFDDSISNGFVSLGKASKATQALAGAINNKTNKADDFGAITKNFTDSIDALIGSGLKIGGLGTLPDQSEMHSLMPDSKFRTTLYGERLVTPELNGLITGTLYNWGAVFHDAEDIAGGKIVQTPTETSSLEMGWNNMKGFQVSIGFDNGYELQSNHLSSASSMDLLKSMLLSGSTETIAAGLQFATVGSTGSASTGPHNHLVGFNPNGVTMAPSDIFAAMGIPADYENSGTALTGLPKDTPYNDPRVLREILNYGPAFDRQAYVDTHAELFQPRIKTTPKGPVTYKFDISTMSYRPHK
jgi:hypothetical protein